MWCSINFPVLDGQRDAFAQDVMIRDQLFKFSDCVASYMHMDDPFFFIDTVDNHLTSSIASLSRLRHFGWYVHQSSKCEWL
jgi:hypothetical protein